MSSVLLEYRLRVRDSLDSVDVLLVSSVRGDALPYLKEPPQGDGAEFDPLTGAYRSGSMTCRPTPPLVSRPTAWECAGRSVACDLCLKELAPVSHPWAAT